MVSRQPQPIAGNHTDTADARAAIGASRSGGNRVDSLLLTRLEAINRPAPAFRFFGGRSREQRHCASAPG
jgi:hypothetical protein